MSLMPAFKLGLWNAWIFTLSEFFFLPICSRIIKRREPDSSTSVLSKREKRIMYIVMVVMIFSYVYSVFLPLKLDTAWFYIGLFIYLLGMIFITVAMLNFATTPTDKPVTKGVYRISRNPMYVGEILINSGIGIACVSWVFLLIAMLTLVLRRFVVVFEEHWTLKKYGNAYREYMDRTPRWIGIPKSENK